METLFLTAGIADSKGGGGMEEGRRPQLGPLLRVIRVSDDGSVLPQQDGRPAQQPPVDIGFSLKSNQDARLLLLLF